MSLLFYVNLYYNVSLVKVMIQRDSVGPPRKDLFGERDFRPAGTQFGGKPRTSAFGALESHAEHENRIE